MSNARMRRRPLLALAAATLATLAGCGVEGTAGGTEVRAPLTLATDSASNPTVAYDARARRGYLAWIGREQGETGVFLVAIDSTGVAATPVRANDIPGDAAPHLQAPAQVTVGPEGTVYVLWQNNTPVEGRRFPASDLRLAVSDDGGRSFRPAITVNDDAGGPPSSHTFHDIAVAADGTVYASWIDSREVDAALHQRLPGGAAAGGSGDGHGPHAGAVGGPEGGRVTPGHEHGRVGAPSGPQVRVARSTDGGRSFEPSVVVDSAACPCCRTSLALGSDGAVYVAWRKIYPGDVRDVVVARAEPGALRFSAPVRVHRDEWVFPGCPHAGPSLALDDEGTLLVGWYTGREDRQGLWYAVSDDGGRTFRPPSPVLTADWVPPSQLRLSVSGNRLWAAWDDRTGERPVVRYATGSAGERLQPVATRSPPGSDPALIAIPEGALLAWLDGSAARAAWVRE